MSKIIVAFDCETGGLNPKQADILTLYMAILNEDFKILEEIDLKLKPDNGFPRADVKALAANKINVQEHLANPNTITYSEAKVKVITLIKKYLKKNGRYSNIRPLGYNVMFDINFIQEHILSKEEWDSMIHYVTIDPKTYTDFLKDCGWWPSNIGNLVSVVEYLQIPMREAHNAKEDTLMTIEVYKKILDLMKAKKENGSNQDLISLLEAE